MRELTYRIVNVFAESIFGGNPLCVFDDRAANRFLTTVEMQALALQFNLSETTFLLDSSAADGRIRIFTPTFEMPFAGHPTLGSAHIVREVCGAGDSLQLEMMAGVIPVKSTGARWELRANPAKTRTVERSDAALAEMLGLTANDVLPGACWVDTGSEQLIVPLASVDAVNRVQPRADLLASLASSAGRSMAYVTAQSGVNERTSRFFFLKHNSIIEDPGTGSATANLGGWLLGQAGTVLPLKLSIIQGEQMNRTCHLGLRLDAEGAIFVSGQVLEIARGTVRLP